MSQEKNRKKVGGAGLFGVWSSKLTDYYYFFRCTFCVPLSFEAVYVYVLFVGRVCAFNLMLF